jgi:hypothetical protein
MTESALLCRRAFFGLLKTAPVGQIVRDVVEEIDKGARVTSRRHLRSRRAPARRCSALALVEIDLCYAREIARSGPYAARWSSATPLKIFYRAHFNSADASTECNEQMISAEMVFKHPCKERVHVNFRQDASASEKSHSLRSQTFGARRPWPRPQERVWPATLAVVRQINSDRE